MMMKNEHKIKEVYPGSIAEELEIAPGDVLVAINNQEIQDVFDYRFLIKDEYIEVLVRKPDGEEWLLEIEKEYEDDLGLEFENDLMSEYRSCYNKCIFCFIDQMPPGMRETLYFKDDDSRLSFMQGNYITLTNMQAEDIDRIIKMQLAPINISVQSTNPQLRCQMLNNRFAGEKLKLIDRLYDGRVEMNGQIVCCKGVNDGEELRRSIEDLSRYLPYMRSVSVVPAGITRFRDGLFPLELFTREEAGEVIDLIEGYQQGFYEKFGLHFVHASDEWYILAGRDFPEEERYDGYIQLENGVGMMRLLCSEFDEAMTDFRSGEDYERIKNTVSRTITVATGRLAYPMMKELSLKLMEAFSGIRVNVCAIRNDFFGETITVSGLITGQDLVAQIKEIKEEGEELGTHLLIPMNMLRAGEEIFLDDMTVFDAEAALGMKVVAVDTSGQDLLNAMLYDDYCMDRGGQSPSLRCGGHDGDNFVYIDAYGNKMD